MGEAEGREQIAILIFYSPSHSSFLTEWILRELRGKKFPSESLHVNQGLWNEMIFKDPPNPKLWDSRKRILFFKSPEREGGENPVGEMRGVG